jgi:hypothetical protein
MLPPTGYESLRKVKAVFVFSIEWWEKNGCICDLSSNAKQNTAGIRNSHSTLTHLQVSSLTEETEHGHSICNKWWRTIDHPTAESDAFLEEQSPPDPTGALREERLTPLSTRG